jgi:hypothetical protein
MGSGIAGVGKSIITSLPAIGGWIASMWAAAAAHLAAFWPVYAIIGGVALLAAGVVLLIKNWGAVSAFFVRLWDGIKGAFSAAWDWIKNIIMGASEWILGAVALFFPFIGIPALIIKHWDTIKEFFGNLWAGITAGFTSAWTGITGFFAGLWDGVKQIFMGFVSWVGSIIEPVIAPFRAIGETVGGIFGKIGGFFKGLVGDSAASGSQTNAAFAGGIQQNAPAPAQAFSQSIGGIDTLMPHSDAQEGPLSRLSASGRALTETFASGMDSDPLGNKAAQVFQAALPASTSITGTSNITGSPLVPQTGTTSALPVPSLASEGIPAPNLDAALPRPGRPERTGAAGDAPVPQEKDGTGLTQTVHIQNLYVQADDCEALFDIIRQLMHITEKPEEAAV